MTLMYHESGTERQHSHSRVSHRATRLQSPSENADGGQVESMRSYRRAVALLQDDLNHETLTTIAGAD